MILNLATLSSIVGRIRPGSKQEANATSLIVALNQYGAIHGLNEPHRLAIFLGQMIHESAAFKYDREIWGPTPAQRRYDTRTDLGNTPEADGDGFLYRGRGPIQITGKSNYRQFTKWAKKISGGTAPDFVASPDLVNVDPWEGLGPIWYWSTRKINALADRGDVRGVTRRINGGFNGLQDRIDQTRAAQMVLLGYKRRDFAKFQQEAGLVADGVPGPKTDAALHEALVAKAPIGGTLGVGADKGAAAGAVGAAAVVGFWDQITASVCKLIDWLPFIANCGG